MTGRSILFLQATEPGAYPPIMNAAFCLADRGWEATLLGAPVKDFPLSVPAHPRVAVRSIGVRRSHRLRPADYLRYHLAAARLALQLRPGLVYASDPMSASPALVAARLSGARLVYHEHDSPTPGSLRPWIAARRRAVASRSMAVVIPNEGRTELVRHELGLPADLFHTVWNVPRLAEVPGAARRSSDGNGPLILYYHGSITPDRLPETLVIAIGGLGGLVRLRVVGYDSPGSQGHMQRLLDLAATTPAGSSIVEYLGALDHRSEVMAEAVRADIGLALMPTRTGDMNMDNMAGASNKAFDYMAAGLPLLVTDRPDWRTLAVDPGYGLAIDPQDPARLSESLRALVADRRRLRAMGESARGRIVAEWHYERAFSPVIDILERAIRS